MDNLTEHATLAAAALRERYEKNVEEIDAERKPGHCLVETVNAAEVEQWAADQIKFIKETAYKMRPPDANGR